MKPTDIIKFTDAATCDAAVWCRKRGITGTVVKVNGPNMEIDVGLYYRIYALMEHIELVAHANDAPIPDDRI
jgi:hypothetical protein